MTITDFKTYFKERREAYSKWGAHVGERINQLLKDRLGPEDVSAFLKIPATPRIKGIDSAIGKISRKGYTNPLIEVTDLVGIRYVVLLSEQIKTLCDLIESEPEWTAQVSKDYIEEIAKNPKIFDYQSHHFEVRPKIDFNIDGTAITADMCCEIQIRTLLQHAYAELVHDSIYKPVGPVPAQAERQIARSMALMETTDELFANTMKLLKEANAPRNKLLNDITMLYVEVIGENFLQTDNKSNYAFLDEFRDVFTCEKDLPNNIRSFIQNKEYIAPKIRSRVTTNDFFAQPMVLIAYWLANHMDTDDFQKRWPLPGYLRDMNILFSDLDLSPRHQS